MQKPIMTDPIRVFPLKPLRKCCFCGWRGMKVQFLYLYVSMILFNFQLHIVMKELKQLIL